VTTTPSFGTSGNGSTDRRTPRMAGMLNGVIDARYRRGGTVDRSTPPVAAHHANRSPHPEVPARTIHSADIARALSHCDPCHLARLRKAAAT
jgi:hypothetical protein